LLDARCEVGYLYLAGLQGVIEPIKTGIYIGGLGRVGIKASGVFAGQSTHFLIDNPHEPGQVLGCEHMFLELFNNGGLEALAVQVAAGTRSRPFLDQGAADVVRELAALGILPDERTAA
jgi:hypothetical protein